MGLMLFTSSCNNKERVWVCPPCGCEAHINHETFDRDGTCPYCGMDLIEKTDDSEINKVDLHTGSGHFIISGGKGHSDDTVHVFYHKPENFTDESPILLVIPGTGRNGDEYRDAWISHSERHGVLVLSPMYTEKDYGFGEYHMGGLMYDMDIYDHIRRSDQTNEVFLDEESFRFEVNADREEWIFNDFDRLFNMIIQETGSERKSYDIFGHSAGGQILHRVVLFYPEIKANRILASNSGFYTMPDLEANLPFGLQNTPVTQKSLRKSFGRKLVLFIGKEDDEDETGGILLRSPSADRQGTHRVARGEYFYRKSGEIAGKMTAEFNWKLEIIPGVGHDSEKMSDAAAEYLYGVH